MMDIKEYFSLKDYNTFSIDATCRYFVESDVEEDFVDFVKSYELSSDDVLILGGGSNFLFTDDFEGVVFYPRMKGCEVIREDDEHVYVRVGSGELWDDFVAWAVEHGYSGVENLSAIPGHVGATPVQNIGAYGMEAGDVIAQVEAVDIFKGGKVMIGVDECHFGYRDSAFKRGWKNRFIVTYVTFCLNKHFTPRLNYGNVKEEVAKLGEVSLVNVRKAVIAIRESKLPDVKIWPNAGSFFKNPVISRAEADALKKDYPGLPVYEVGEGEAKLAAGWLIEQAGWKGKSLGNAAVHDKQALVLVNRGHATGLEIACLANEIKKAVFMRFGVMLEPEVNII